MLTHADRLLSRILNVSASSHQAVAALYVLLLLLLPFNMFQEGVVCLRCCIADSATSMPRCRVLQVSTIFLLAR